MYQAEVRRLHNPCNGCHVRKVARLLAQALNRDRERFGEWMGRHVLGTKDFAAYMKSIEREEAFR